jgi:hypothetical protein
MAEMLHDREKPNVKDRFFISGGNPETDSGGGVIGSRDTIDGAKALQREAIKLGYRRVKIQTWDELMNEPEEG